MGTYYSIIFVTLRPATMERLSIGLLLFDKQNVYYKFSHSKLAAIKSLLGKDAYKSINDSLKTIDVKVHDDNSQISNIGGFKLFKNHELEESFSSSYISYLSRYKNNLINYSEPKEVEVDVNEKSLAKLFNNYIGETFEDRLLIMPEVFHPLQTFKNKFQSKIEHHFIQERTITYLDVPNLIVPVQVDLVGRNGIDVFVQSIDTLSQPGTIIKDVSTFYLLKDTYKKNKMPIKDFLLSKEPPTNMKRQHDLWKHFYKSKEFTYVDIGDSDVIIKYAEQNNVQPSFGKDDNDGGVPF